LQQFLTLVKPVSHPIINLVLNGMAFAVLVLLILWAANLAVDLWIRIRDEWPREKSGHRPLHDKPHPKSKPHEKEDGIA
jgi:hypothetical protein